MRRVRALITMTRDEGVKIFYVLSKGIPERIVVPHRCRICGSLHRSLTSENVSYHPASESIVSWWVVTQSTVETGVLFTVQICLEVFGEASTIARGKSGTCVGR